VSKWIDEKGRERISVLELESKDSQGSYLHRYFPSSLFSEVESTRGFAFWRVMSALPMVGRRQD
jgi:hypothetical protein